MKLIIKIWLVLFVVILSLVFIGYRSINQPAPIPERTYIMMFEHTVEARVLLISEEFGSVTIKEFDVEFNCDELCVYGTGEIILKYEGQEISKMELEEISVEQDFCIKPTQNKFRLRFEGIGGATRISVPAK